MKTLRLFALLLFRGRRKPETQKPDLTVVHSATDAPVEKPAAKSAPPSDDDSPPGYKVRWHH